MYPLGMTRSLAVAAGLRRARGSRHSLAASLDVMPQKRCYSSGESVNLLGAGFSPLGTASVTRDGAAWARSATDGNGAFIGSLTLAQTSGRRTKTYTATDSADPDAHRVEADHRQRGATWTCRPPTARPGARLSIKATRLHDGQDAVGARERKGRSKRTLKIGRLSRAPAAS